MNARNGKFGYVPKCFCDGGGGGDQGDAVLLNMSLKSVHGNSVRFGEDNVQTVEGVKVVGDVVSAMAMEQ